MNLLEQTLIKSEYPVMPKEIRDMVEEEVKRQMENEGGNKEVNMGKSFKKYIKAAALGLTLGAVTVGGCVTAHQLYVIHSERVGNYGMEIGMDTAKGGKAGEGENKKLAIDIKNMPEDMVFSGLEEGSCKINVIDKDGNLPATIYVFSLVDGYETFKVMDNNVKETEEFNIDGNPAVYVDLSYVESGTFQNTSKVYIVYPELNHLVMIWGHNGISRDEMINMAKGITLTEAGPEDKNILEYAMELKAGETPFQLSPDVLAAREADKKTEMERAKTYATKEEFLSNLHKIGEEVMLNGEGDSNVSIKLASVKICDNISEVPEGIYNHIYGADIKKHCDSEGNFISEELQYVKSGDGVESVDEIINTEVLDEKLVVLEFEYTNKGNEDMGGYVFNPGFIVTVRNQGEGYEIYNYNTLAKEAGADYAAGKNYEGNGLPSGWDSNNKSSESVEKKNHITDFKAGETRTVYSAFFVNENQLSDLYVDILSGWEDNGSFGIELEEERVNVLEKGYFDIRQ